MAARTGTVAFFEIVRAKDGVNPRMEHMNWQTPLSEIEGRPVSDRILTHAPHSYIGQSVLASGRFNLLVGRVGASELQTVDLDLGRIEEMRLEGNKGTIDTTTVCFLDYGNIIGVLQGKPGSPRASSIQRWLNGCDVADEEIALWPVISQNVWEKLEKAEAVHSFEFSYRPSPAIPPPDGEGLSSFIQLSSERYPDHRVTLKLEVPKRNGPGPLARLRAQRRLQGDIHSLMSELGYLEEPSGIDRAQANVTLRDEDGDTVDEPLDFIKHHIAVKCRIEVGADFPRPRYESAVDAILQVARDRECDLRAAVSA
ncbi:hypothetical protein [Streptomyces erythrochromogenes]|uniref:hypothetical protein n=1 Tax=Streptomyces erythrochromogenes TaxID=285574 RepID=UPI00131C9F81|nr:hypothetical protein [Streptomyces erythrochromogenes]